VIEGLGTVLTGLSAVIIALGTFYSQRSKKDRTDRKADARLLERYRRRDQAALRHILRLELLLMELAAHDAPGRPAELGTDWLLEDGDEKTKQVTT
jgi:hypothetical protein